MWILQLYKKNPNNTLLISFLKNKKKKSNENITQK